MSTPLTFKPREYKSHASAPLPEDLSTSRLGTRFTDPRTEEAYRRWYAGSIIPLTAFSPRRSPSA